MSRLRIWNQHHSWEEAEKTWDAAAELAAKSHPLKSPKTLPNMAGMTEETKHLFRWKALKWMVIHDREWIILKHCLKRPLKYGWNYLKSLLRGKSYTRDGDFFLYNLKNVQELKTLLKTSNHLFILGFSYCHKPFECPSGRFTDACIHDAQNPICQQCFIGKTVHALPEGGTVPLFIPTVHYIGRKIFELMDSHPDKQILFLITACEMTLEMFGDWGNMVGIRGIGVRLDGRICNTMKAFELSEQGVKPGLTVVLPETQRRILDILASIRQ